MYACVYICACVYESMMWCVCDVMCVYSCVCPTNPRCVCMRIQLCVCVHVVSTWGVCGCEGNGIVESGSVGYLDGKTSGRRERICEGLETQELMVCLGVCH